MANNERKFRYCCVRCRQEFYARLDYHLKNCKDAIEGIDFIKCAICNYRGSALYMHIKKHNISIKEYELEYGSAYSKNSLIAISIRNSIMQKKSNYRNKLKKEGNLEKLEKFNQKVSNSISKAIMNNPKERSRRSELLGKLNKREDFRERASKTAIKTSARRDIQLQRTERLEKWRDENPEKFREIIKKAHRYQSEPEKKLYQFILSIDNNFKRNKLLKRRIFRNFNKSGTKQLDIFSKQKKIIIEFDGIFHFKNIEKWNQLDTVRAKDEALNEFQDEFCIIRVSHDQFCYKKNNGFNEDCLNEIKNILNNPHPGLYCIGEAYGENNIL